MGEYATYGSDGKGRAREVKIGTYEDMYYLRYAQRHSVQHLSGNVDPVAHAEHLRYRFPWPDEDGTAPGAYSSEYKLVHIPGLTAPPETEHHTVQFSAQAGYLVSLPCPEDGKLWQGDNMAVVRADGLRVHRNGFRGAVHMVAQRYRPETDRLVPILQCGGCGSMYRVENLAEIEEIAMLCRSEADRVIKRAESVSAGVWWHTVADRLLAGAGLLTKGPAPASEALIAPDGPSRG